MPTILSIASLATKDWATTEIALRSLRTPPSLTVVLRARGLPQRKCHHLMKYYDQSLRLKAPSGLISGSYLLCFGLFPSSSLYLHVFL